MRLCRTYFRDALRGRGVVRATSIGPLSAREEGALACLGWCRCSWPRYAWLRLCGRILGVRGANGMRQRVVRHTFGVLSEE